MSKAWVRDRLLSGVAASAVLLSSPALFAQESDGQSPPQQRTAASNTVLGDIIVTGRLREENLQTVPLSISAFGEAQIENLVPDTLSDFQKRLPNVILSDINFSGNSLAASIRGISFADLEKTFENAIGVSIDGVFLGTNTGAAFEISDIESIEVLRGPQGTLQGRNTIGGSINVRRTRPTNDMGMNLNLRYSRYDNIDGTLVMNTGLLGDSFAIKLFGNLKKGDSHTFNRTLNRQDEGKDYVSGGIAVAIRPPESDWDALITVEYLDDNSKFPSVVGLTKPGGGTFCDITLSLGSDAGCDTASIIPIAEEGFGIGFQPIPFQNEMEQWAFTAEINGQLGGVGVKSITGYRDSNELLREENTGSPPVPVPVAPGVFVELPLFVAVRDQTYSQFSQELQFSFKPMDIVDVVAGIYYLHTQYELQPGPLDPSNPNSPVGLAFVLGGPVNSATAGQTLNSYAAFAEGIWSVTDSVRLTTGVRYTKEKKDFTLDQVIAASFSVDTSESWGKLTGRVLLDWQATDDVLLYGGWSRGFRAGGFNGRGSNFISASTSYDPETVDSFEIGAKTTWMDGRLRFNPAIFYAKYKDVQQDIIVPSDDGSSTNTFVENAGAGEIYGAEADMEFQPIDQLTINAALGLLNAKYTEFLVFDADAGMRVDVSNQRQWRRAPDVSASVGGTWRQPVGEGTVVLNTNLSYVDDYATSPVVDPFGREIIEHQTKLDLSIAYEQENLGALKKFRISAYGKDLTAGQDGRLNTTLDAGVFFFGLNVPARTYGVELTANF